MEEFIINIKNTLNDFFIYSKWNETEILFKIIDQNDNYWTGSIQLEEIQNIASELEIDYNIFIDEIKNSLIKTSETFCYEIQNEKFLLKKQGDLIIIYLEIDLIQLNENLRNDLLLKSIEINSLNDKKLNEITGKYEINSKELNKLKTDMEKLIEDKSKTENILLNKFSMLLNSKKDEITKLKELLYEKDQSLVNQNNSSGDNTTDDELDNFSAPTQQLINKEQPLPKRKK